MDCTTDYHPLTLDEQFGQIPIEADTINNQTPPHSSSPSDIKVALKLIAILVVVGTCIHLWNRYKDGPADEPEDDV